MPQMWYVLRVTYQRELAAKRLLDDSGISNFVPTKLVRRRGCHGRFTWEREVAVHNYVFAYATREEIQRLKQTKIPYLRYVMTSRDGRSSYLTVPDEQMRNFIAVAGNEQERVTFLDPAAVPVAEGDRVRITGGPFEGVEGVCVRMHNGRDRRVSMNKLAANLSAGGEYAFAHHWAVALRLHWLLSASDCYNVAYHDEHWNVEHPATGEGYFGQLSLQAGLAWRF